MTYLRQIIQTTRFLFFISIGMSLFWESCGRLKSPELQEDCPLDTLHFPKASTLMYYYLESYGELDTNFYFGNNLNDPLYKVLHYSMDTCQLKYFISELERLKPTPHTKDPVRIRVHCAFLGPDGTKNSKNSNASLLVELISSKIKPSERVFYPLHPHKALNKAHLSANNGPVDQARISDSLAGALYFRWANLPAKKITNQLYPEQTRVALGDRLKYYTFNVSDTYEVYQFLVANKPQVSFAVLFGIEDVDLKIPLRTIIRVSNTLLDLAAGAPLNDDDGDEDYEFAVQCPNQCN